MIYGTGGLRVRRDLAGPSEIVLKTTILKHLTKITFFAIVGFVFTDKAKYLRWMKSQRNKEVLNDLILYVYVTSWSLHLIQEATEAVVSTWPYEALEGDNLSVSEEELPHPAPV